MKIVKLEIKNYKSIKELNITDLRDLNVFIGKNDAGKSNILGALDIVFNSNLRGYTCCSTAVSENVLETLFDGESTRMFYNKKRPYAEFIVYLSIGRSELERYGIRVSSDENEIVVSKKITTSSKKTKISLDFLRVNKDVIVRTPDEKERFKTEKGYTANFKESIAYKLLTKLNNEFILIPADRNIIRSPSEQSEKMKADQYIKDSLIELANNKDEDKKKLFSQFTELIKKISPLIQRIEAITKGGKVVDLEFKTSKGESIPLSTIGGGNNELLLLLHEIIISGGLILAIEEPEIHLHPQGTRKLYRFMEEFAQATQMFVVTHTPVFVEPKNIRGLFRVVKGSSGTKVYSMSEHDHINHDRLEQELNTENCEMFFADKVLLVEGISDKIFMEGLIRKYCKSTDEIKVVSSYSKDNFAVYSDLLRIFNIPFIVMTDLDALKGGFQIKLIWRELKHQKLKGKDEKIAHLKTKNIHVLSNGSLESCYPKQYRRHVSKPLDSLYAIHNLTEEDYMSERMRDLREVIEALEK